LLCKIQHFYEICAKFTNCIIVIIIIIIYETEQEECFIFKLQFCQEKGKRNNGIIDE